MDLTDSDQDYDQDDSDYDYTGEESATDDVIEDEEEDEEEEERCRFNWHDEDEDSTERGIDCVDWEYCEMDSQSLASRRRLEPPQVYAPERGPPLLDFLFVLTAFFAAAFAAFYTILSETGIPNK